MNERGSAIIERLTVGKSTNYYVNLQLCNVGKVVASLSNHINMK